MIFFYLLNDKKYNYIKNINIKYKTIWIKIEK
jgi:hypothetical protein